MARIIRLTTVTAGVTAFAAGLEIEPERRSPKWLI